MKKIIIIDDDAAIRDSLQLVFDPADFKLVFYPNGNAILDGGFELPDLFVIDKQLAGIDGLEVCKYLKSQEATRHVPVIMMSASPLISKLSKLAGADQFIEKPFTIKYLRDTVARGLSK